MTFVPRHYRKRDPWRRAQIVPQRIKPRPDCRCSHRWGGHDERGDERGRCLHPRCACLGYRPVGSTGEDTTDG